MVSSKLFSNHKPSGKRNLRSNESMLAAVKQVEGGTEGGIQASQAVKPKEKSEWHC